LSSAFDRPRKAKKRLGQHFLSDPRILARIADAVAPASEETVLEIGPGPGGLTEALAKRTKRLICIEKDRDLVPALRQRFPAVEVVEADALKTDWHELVGTGPFVIAGNIPYNITSPLIDLALAPPRPRRVVYLVQKEVAERLGAKPGGAEYGALTVGVSAVARVERLFTVPAGAFHPRPAVDSAVVRLTPLDSPPLADEEVASFRRFVVGLFGFRRKQLIRGIRELTGLTAERVAAILEQVGISKEKRPQELTSGQFLALHAALQ
jgi:16S rRNA (adenine1518-N6/adenine1519-N6)-dimethyltransferase